MAILSATFEAIDKMSDKFDKMASSGERAFEQWERAGEVGNEAFEQTAKAATQTATAMETASQSTDHWTEKIGYYDKGAMEAIYSTEELVEMGYKTADALEDAAGGAEEFGDELNDAGDQADEFGEKSVNSVEMLQDALVAAGITKLLSAIGDAFIDCMEDAIEFESAITGVYKTVDGTPEQLAEITDEVKELALRIPSTTTEIAGVAEAAGQLGIATDDIMSFTEVMINLGEATNLSSDEAATSLAKFANITKMEAENYENLGSTVVALGNNFATTEADIVAMSMRMASAGELAGMSEPQILALAASLSSVGIEADAGGSSMSTLLSKMQLAAETGSAELEQFASVSGMTSEEFQRQWSEDAVTALYAFIAGLNDTERNGASATAVLDEMGITEIRLSNAVKSLANNHEGLADAIALADNAWVENNALATEANTRYATLESRLAMTKNAANNLSIAVGDDLSNAVSSLLPVGTTIINGITTIVEKCPAVTAVIVGATGALATLVVGVTAYTLYTKYATAVTTAFTAAMNANPFILVATAVVGLVAGIAVLASNMDSAEEEFVKLTASSEKQANKIAELEKEYQRLCDAGKENTEEAIALKFQIDSLTESFEGSKQTLEEYISACEEANTAWNETLDSNREAFEAVETNEGCYLALTHRLEELASQSEITVASQEEMKAIIDELNEAIPGLSLNYDNVVSSAGDFGKAVENMIKAQATMQRYETAQQGMIDAYNKRYEAEQQMSDLRAQEAAELANNTKLQEQYNAAYSAYTNWNQQGGRGTNPYEKNKNDLKKALDESDKALESYKTQINETQDTINTAQADYDKYLGTISEIAGVTEDAFNELSSAEGVIDAMATSVSSLGTAYNDAYVEAQKSFEGQFGLFDKAKADADATVANMQSALNSQLSFWETYAANLDTLKTVSAEDLGVTQAQYDKLIAFASEGSEEAAGLAQSMANAIKSGNEESIIKVVNTLDKIEEAKAKAASAAAEWQIDFSGKMDDIVKKAETAINDMNLSPEADAAAKATMNAYAEAIRTQGATAIANAQSIASQVKTALQSASTTINIGVTGNGTTGKGYATGTDFATPGWHLVGENGPEIVEFAGGETVYPADETARMLASMRPTPLNTNVPESLTGQKTEDVATKDKRIVVAIEGGGEISVKGDVSKETVVELLVSNLKPVLLNMIQEEVFEEGDGSYEY